MTSQPGFLGPSLPRAAESLLDQIAESALDDDYYMVRAGRAGRGRFSPFVFAIFLTALAMVITLAAVQARSVRPVSQVERQGLASDVSARKSELAARQSQVEKLSQEVNELRASLPDGGEESQTVLDGSVAVSGEGLTLRVYPSDQGNLDGRVLAADLQIMVNGLWYVGAEAIAVNGRRLGALSSIRPFEGGITVDYRRIAAPYLVEAIGDPDQLETRFESSAVGRYWKQRTSGTGITVAMRGSSNLQLQSAPQRRTQTVHAKLKEKR